MSLCLFLATYSYVEQWCISHWSPKNVEPSRHKGMTPNSLKQKVTIFSPWSSHYLLPFTVISPLQFPFNLFFSCIVHFSKRKTTIKIFSFSSVDSPLTMCASLFLMIKMTSRTQHNCRTWSSAFWGTLLSHLKIHWASLVFLGFYFTLVFYLTFHYYYHHYYYC